GFAATLHAALTAAGRRVHTAPMNAWRAYPAAQQMFVLAATYGNGTAPASAKQFLDRLAQHPVPPCPVAVLGFGDRMFPQYCAYAEQVQTALAAKGAMTLHPLTMIDRQSPVDFAAWGRAVGAAIGLDLVLDHHAALPPLRTLTLISRQDFGQEVQAPATILRFGPGAAATGWRALLGNRLPRFEAGDLVGIVPPGSDLPRYYSLASSRADGVLEICVRKAPGGLCSGHLHGLVPGDSIAAFIRPNPEFRPQKGKSPVVLIAAGCGIGPMAGFLRRNRPGRQMELYFGTRDPASDFLYEQELGQWQAEGRLTRLATAFSRVNGRTYVQDRLRTEAEHLCGL
ncbi:MAG: NADPH cytochrome P450 oxidoreductase family protein, partial [Paracoccaceae bacterium]|nr:NADPH cytochrome P450 oxidoreductase family protein [Paracoccaceae bacterium]